MERLRSEIPSVGPDFEDSLTSMRRVAMAVLGVFEDFVVETPQVGELDLSIVYAGAETQLWS